MGDNEKCSIINPGFAIGLLLVCGGVLLFIDNVGLFPFPATRLFWPIMFFLYGAALLRSSQSAMRTVWGIAAVTAGILYTLKAFELLHITGQILWALSLIACGVIMLIYRLDWPRGTGEYSGGPDRLHELAVFSGSKRKLETFNFEGGELWTIFGGIQIDLRRAHIASVNGQVVIEANAAFGGIEIRVPEEWRVSIQGTAIFGAYEDKSLPPRPEPGVNAPLLIIRGGVAFGGVAIQN